MILLQLYNKKIVIKDVLIFSFFLVLSILCLLFLIVINYRCPFHEYLNIWCAGCGGTRMLISFVHLDFYQAFRWNPLLFILLIIGIIYFIIGIIVYIKNKVIVVPKLRVFIFIIGILIVFMILRNMDLFSFLIPTKIR